ncbi:MAG: tRNA pseudouridine(38-40) synthase TruA [Firmicutes bacterium]|nr:tRNA pseudouridine(38-40) synthase TruA [Bacillota bacterium]
MRNIKIIIEYDGTKYSGWQMQKNSITIQEELQKAIFKITGERVNIIGAGRTDAGVHAKGQVANFITKSGIPEKQFSWALNSVLKKDIVVKDSQEMPIDFHACFDAKSKIYSYTIYNSVFPPGIMRDYMYHFKYKKMLEIEKIKEAADCFVGTFDFKGFMAAGSSIKNTVRTIYSIEIIENDDIIKILYHGNGFLYKMIRMITGTILYAGINKINIEEILKKLETGNKKILGATAPAHGLCLEKVFYVDTPGSIY